MTNSDAPQDAVATVKTSEYVGYVGGLKAVYSLEWQADGKVSGTYHYPSRKEVIYQLSGSNYAEGLLHLDEYSQGKLSARCELRKVIENKSIVWTGTMSNVDGRSFDMTMKKAQ